jgi:hypothetical protein
LIATKKQIACHYAQQIALLGHIDVLWFKQGFEWWGSGAEMGRMTAINRPFLTGYHGF